MKIRNPFAFRRDASVPDPRRTPEAADEAVREAVRRGEEHLLGRLDQELDDTETPQQKEAGR